MPRSDHTITRGIGGHQRAYRGKTDDWLTPPEIIAALGQFDLDPCCPEHMPWATASLMLWHGGLTEPWAGRVWVNPPYGPETGKWLRRLADHGDGIALIFARTETDMFHRYVWDRAAACLFLRGRITFCLVDGSRSRFNSGGPSVLVAYGFRNADALRTCGLAGKFISLRGDE